LPGTNGGPPANSPTVISAFHSALLHQVIAIAVIAFILLTAGKLFRSVQSRSAKTRLALPAGETDLEPSARRLLRIAFGLLWIFDGLLESQSSMPLGMTAKVMRSASAASPRWVQHIVSFAATIWAEHPIAASTAAVWIQVGIGLWMLVAPRGYWSRASGAVSVAWGLVIWVFAQAFGGIFAPGVSWLFGAPGSAVFYCVAGVVVALPDRSFASGRIGTVLARGVGALFLVMALVQALPRRGFWQGRLPGSFAGRTFGSFDLAHGFAVNFFVVVMLATAGVAFVSGRPRVLRYAVPVTALVCLADWVFVQDLGFLGGTGTDPNSMIPIGVVLVAAYMALTRAEVSIGAEVLGPSLELAADLEPVVTPVPGPRPGVLAPLPRPGWRERVTTRPAYVLRVLAAAGAALVVLLGATPMAFASLSQRADPIVSQAIDGAPLPLDSSAPGWSLIDQAGNRVALSRFRGKLVVLAFLDPVCTSDCSIIGEELRQADNLLGPDTKQVEFIAIVTNPRYRSVAATNAFDREERLNWLTNWMFLTGSLSQLSKVWSDYGIEIAVVGGGAMVAHNDLVFVIDPTGRERFALNSSPGPGTLATQASYASLLAGLVQQALAGDAHLTSSSSLAAEEMP